MQNGNLSLHDKALDVAIQRSKHVTGKDEQSPINRIDMKQSVFPFRNNQTGDECRREAECPTNHYSEKYEN
jgi:hypothetical protein